MSGAERQRRHRRHKAGDHSLCIPGNCEAVTPVVTDDVTSDGPSPEVQRPKLRAAGTRLWLAMTKDADPPPMQRVLLLEACRIADRLDKLDEQLDGGEWLRLEVDETGRVAVVVINKPLAEARQQALALKQIVAELRQVTAKAAAGPSKSASAAQSGQEVAAGVTSIAGKLAAKRGAASAG